MKTAIIALTLNGLERAKTLSAAFDACEVYVPLRFMDHLAPGTAGFTPLEPDFRSAAAKIFKQYDALIFIAAVAVAVRAIAPCLNGKEKDPAVVVIDDGGRYAISLLSGHLGGANELAAKIAGLIGAEAVITTATDGRKVTSFDSLARQFGWSIENLPVLKEISAALLEEREILLYSDQPVEAYLQGRIRVVQEPEKLLAAEHGSVVISSRREVILPLPAGPCLLLRPRNIAAGVGCRKGVLPGPIIEAVRGAFESAGLAIESLSCLASGEFKSGEPGLLEAAKTFGVPFKTYEREAIERQTLAGRTSSFVESQVGVGAVAEPCAVLGSGEGMLIQPVIRGGGITVALAEGPLIPKERLSDS